MFGLSIRSVMESRKLVVAAPDASVREAARLMKEARVGGARRQRRAARRHLHRGATRSTASWRWIAIRARLDSRVMTPGPKTLSPDEPFGHALLLMNEHGFAMCRS